MNKKVILGQEAREGMLKGLNKVADAVKITLGPKGRNSALDTDYSTVVTNDGATIANSILLGDNLENMGAKLIRQAANKTNSICGDGTTTSTILTQSIVKEGIKNITAGANPILVRNGINKAVELAIKEIDKISKPIEGKKDMMKVAAISANDEFIGKIIGEAIDKVGVNGAVSVEDSKSMETYLEMVEGMSFDKGYISPYMITNSQRMSSELNNPFVLITDKVISSYEDILPVLELTMQSGKQLFIIAEDVEGEALATIVYNKTQGRVTTVAVKAPHDGEEKKSILEDMAILTGATLVSDEIGLSLKDVELDHLGMCEKVKVTQEKTIIIGGLGSEENLNERRKMLEEAIKEEKDNDKKDKIKERLSKLSWGVAVIRVGDTTDVAMNEKRLRIEDALNSTRAAVEEGIVAGGGTTYCYIINKVAKLKSKSRDEQVGIDIILSALEAPLRQIATNSGVEGSIVIDKVKKSKRNVGYDALNDKFVDMLKAGVIDPTKVSKSALINAASVASSFLTTESVVVKENTKK